MARGNCKKEIYPNDKVHELKPGDIVEVYNPCEGNDNNGFIYKFMVKGNKFPDHDSLKIAPIGPIEFYGDISFVEHLLRRNATLSITEAELATPDNSNRNPMGYRLNVNHQYIQRTGYYYTGEDKSRSSNADGFLRFCHGFAKPIIYLIG